MIAVERLNLGCVDIGWRHDAVSMVRQSSRADLSREWRGIPSSALWATVALFQEVEQAGGEQGISGLQGGAAGRGCGDRSSGSGSWVGASDGVFLGCQL